MYEIIKSIEDFALLGTSIMCADGKVRQIFPRILMLSADYEEQYAKFKELKAFYRLTNNNLGL
jgi:hypothetical protein